MEKKSSVDFALVVNIEGMHFQPHRPKGIEFTPNSDECLRFVLFPTDAEKDASGHRMGLTCKVYKSYPATLEQEVFVKSYNQKKIVRLAQGIFLPYEYKGKVLIDADGSFADGFSPRRYLCPIDIVALIEHAEADLTSQVDRLLKLLRWRQNCDSAGEIVKDRSLYWRIGEGTYPHAPLGGGPSSKVTIPAMYGIHWAEKNKNNLNELWSETDLTEPLGHTLLRESISLSEQSPRSAILMMTAALETAVKMHISKIAPNTAWLMEETPSPPLFKMLRDYIPLVHRNSGNEIIFWDKIKPLLKTVQNLVEVRNKIAHTGKIPEGAASIQDYMVLVSDFLYLLDVLEGREWAKSLVSFKLRESLGWPHPKDGRATLIISQGY